MIVYSYLEYNIKENNNILLGKNNNSVKRVLIGQLWDKKEVVT